MELQSTEKEETIPDVLDFNLYIIGKVCEEMAATFIPDLFNLAENILTFFPDPKERPPITISISTFGGDILEMFAIYDAIKRVQAMGIDIETLGLGKVMSSGLVLLAAGTKGMRYAGKYTRFMFHEVAAEFSGTNHEIDEQKKEIEFSQEQYIDVLSFETQKTKKFFEKHIKKHAEFHFNCDEALKWNLIDEID